MERMRNLEPGNFEDIRNYVTTDVKVICEEIACAKKCYFYDTGAFRNHAILGGYDYILNYIKSTSGIVVITRGVLMELCSGDGCIWREHIEYIKRMNCRGIKVLVIYEEDVFEILHTYCADVFEINRWLSWAVKLVKSKVGAVELVLGQNVDLRRMLLEKEGCKDSRIAEKLFCKVREFAYTGDNAGEEMLAICLHWLSRMRESESYKYVLLIDDKRAMGTFSKVMRNVREYCGMNTIAVCTTIKLFYLMRLNNIIYEEAEMIKMLKCVNRDGCIKVYCSEEYDLRPEEKKMIVDTYVRKVFEGKMKVYY